MKIVLEAKCGGGHQQTITYEGDWVGREYVETFAKMLDGSAVQRLPGPRIDPSGIGKCGKCGTQINCTITNVVEDNRPPCVACHGTGKSSPFSDAVTCPRCHGDGRVAA